MSIGEILRKYNFGVTMMYPNCGVNIFMPKNPLVYIT